MKLATTDEERKVVEFYDEETHLLKLVEELDELKRATNLYLIARTMKGEACKESATAGFIEEFVDVVAVLCHVYEKTIRPDSELTELCNRFEKYKLARQLVRMSLKDESFGSTKQREAA